MMAEQMSLASYDPCARKHGNNPQSVAAHAAIAETKHVQRAKVLAAIVAAGREGLTVDESAVLLDTTPNAISGRFTELRAAELILKVGTRPTRSGHAAGVFISA